MGDFKDLVENAITEDVSFNAVKKHYGVVKDQKDLFTKVAEIGTILSDFVVAIGKKYGKEGEVWAQEIWQGKVREFYETGDSVWNKAMKKENGGK